METTGCQGEEIGLGFIEAHCIFLFYTVCTESKRYVILQWKEHGLFGVPMEYAKEHVIALQCIIEQETTLEV